MQKNLKTSFILLIVMSAIIIAFTAITTFFGATGIAFAGLLISLAFIVILNITDEYVGKRIKDLLIIASIFTICEFIIYFFVDYVASWKINNAVFGIQNIISLFGIFFLAYIVFRFIYEIKSLKLSFIEGILGNGEKKEKQPKQKKNKKELENGSLDEKPVKTESEIPNMSIFDITENTEE